MPFPDHLLIPREVLKIAERLLAAGFDTWCVGGAIRDNLLGLENKDFDLTTAAHPEDVQQLFKRTIPIGVDHGTVAVLDRHRTPHEVTTFRRDVTTDGRRARVAFGVSLDEDLARRDFTINAIAYHPLRHEWRDPFDGAGDLERKLIRAVGDPAERFQEDFLRILRALRFAARFEFEIDAPTWEAAVTGATGLAQLSAERVRDEWFRGLESAQCPSELVRLWGEVGALREWLPEVSGALGAGGDGVPVVDRFEDRDPVLLTAYLSSDPARTLERLRASNAEIERGRSIGLQKVEWPDPELPGDVRHWLASVGEVADDLVAIAAAEGRGGRLAVAVQREREAGVPLRVADLAVDGNDLKKIGVPEGPMLGQVLTQLLEQVLADPSMNDKARLLKAARALASSTPAHRSRHTREKGGGKGP